MKTDPNSSGVFNLLFGKTLTTASVIVSAVIIVIPAFMLFELPALIPLPTFPVPTIPCDYQAVAGVLFFMTIILRKPWQVLRFPRHNSVLFVIGLTWSERMIHCKVFTKRKMLECLLFLGVLFSVRYVLVFIFDHHWTITGLLLPEIPVFMIFGVLYTLSDKIVESIPCSKKEYVTAAHNTISSGIHSEKGGTYLSIARIIASAIPKPVHTIVVRMILYIIRRDALGAMFLHLSAVIICSIAAFVLPQSVEMLVRIVLVAVPVFLFSEHHDAIRGAIEKTIDCPYWNFSSRQIVLAGTVLYGIISMPYLLIFIVRQIVHLNSADFVAIINFFIATIALCTVAGRSFFISAWDKKENAGSLVIWAGSVILCLLMPILGVIFSTLILASNGYYIYKSNFLAIRKDE
jgi:hypothetical protein